MTAAGDEYPEVTLVLAAREGPAALLKTLGLELRAMQPRGARQFCELRYADGAGREVLCREDHILGLRVLFVGGPSADALAAELAAALPVHTLPRALSAAETAITGRERVATLGPLCALLAYTEHQDADWSSAAYALLGLRLRDREPAVRRAALCGAAYLLAPEVDELLQLAASDPELLPEVRRQLALRDRVRDPLDYAARASRAEAERAAGRLFSALVEACTALALARRAGVKLHGFMALRDGLYAALADPLPDDVHALAPVQVLLELERFHEVEEVASALLSLGPEPGTSRLPLPLRASVVSLLAEALAGRGRPDLAGAALEQVLAEIDSRLAAGKDNPEVRLAAARLQKHL